MDIPQQNTGVRLGVRESDFIAGTLPYEAKTNGDWRPFLPTEERQYSDNTDTMACVSFSLNNAMEMQYKQQTGKEINFSDRWLAKMSDTQKFGNWQYKVADTVRMFGLVFESEYPTPDKYTWDSFYSNIPQSIRDTAKKYESAYEWIMPSKSELEKHLKHAPLQIVITKANPNHAVVLVAIEGDTAYYFDTYPPYLKTIKISSIYNSLKFIINFKNDMFPAIKKAGEPTIYAQCGNTLFPFSSGEAFIRAGGIFGKEKELPESEFYKFDIQAESIINNK